MKRIIMPLFATLALTLWAGNGLFAQAFQSDDIVGNWLNEEGTGQVEIFKVGTTYYGKIVWLQTPNDSITGLPRTDKENPDPAQQKRPLIGLVNLKGFVFDGDNEWKEGTIYDPKNGKTYSCYMKFVDDTKSTLKIRGFIGISLLGRTTYWTPVEK
ncbi:MAG: DUF2147 domain-containing protein [Bacteroidetes bacterium]|nr:MAG: DUF2147 domain-containing protein [Bacteroidota bacterium]